MKKEHPRIWVFTCVNKLARYGSRDALPDLFWDTWYYSTLLIPPVISHRNLPMRLNLPNSNRNPQKVCHDHPLTDDVCEVYRQMQFAIIFLGPIGCTLPCSFARCDIYLLRIVTCNSVGQRVILVRPDIIRRIIPRPVESSPPDRRTNLPSEVTTDPLIVIKYS